MSGWSLANPIQIIRTTALPIASGLISAARGAR
jgi:hypothetical protein